MKQKHPDNTNIIGNTAGGVWGTVLTAEPFVHRCPIYHALTSCYTLLFLQVLDSGIFFTYFTSSHWRSSISQSDSFGLVQDFKSRMNSDKMCIFCRRTMTLGTRPTSPPKAHCPTPLQTFGRWVYTLNYPDYARVVTCLGTFVILCVTEMTGYLESACTYVYV